MAHFLLHVVIPAIDTIIGKDARNPTDEEIKLLEKDPYYSRLVKVLFHCSMRQIFMHVI